MNFVDITEKNKDEFNKAVTHPLQSYEWGEFREKTGVKVIRRGVEKDGKIVEGFTLTLHKVPQSNFKIGYLPKGTAHTKKLLEELIKIGKENNCIFIQLEPNIEKTHQSLITNHKSLVPSARPLFTKYTFEINLEKSEEELL